MKKSILPLFFLVADLFVGCHGRTPQPSAAADDSLPAEDTATAGKNDYNPNVQGNFQEKPPAFQPAPTPQTLQY